MKAKKVQNKLNLRAFHLGNKNRFALLVQSGIIFNLSIGQ